MPNIYDKQQETPEGQLTQALDQVAHLARRLPALIQAAQTQHAEIVAGTMRDAYYLGRVHERQGRPLTTEQQAYMDEIARDHASEVHP